MEELERHAAGVESAINMCVIEGARLLNHVITTFTTRSSLLCVTLCSRQPGCMSINYHFGTNTCEINNRVATDYRAVDDFSRGLSQDNLYYSTSEC